MLYTAEEEAARRARIEERLAQSLGTKKKDSGKGTACSQTTNERQKKPSDSSTSLAEQLDRRHVKKNEHTAIKTPHQPSSKKPVVDRMRQSLDPVNKNSELNSKKSVEKVKKGKGNVKKGPPMDFKALLAIAERNKNGNVKLQSLEEHGSSVKQQESKEGKGRVKQSSKSSEQGKMLNPAHAKALKEEKTNGQMQSKERSKLKEKGIPDKTLPSMGDRKLKHDSKQSGLANGSRVKGLGSKISSSITHSASHTGKLINSKTFHPSNERQPIKERHLSRKKHLDTLKRKRSPFDDEMNDFIDDGDGDDVDVSKYIKEIFGYDRTRFVSLLDNDTFEPSASNHSKCKAKVVSYGRWSLTRF